MNDESSSLVKECHIHILEPLKRVINHIFANGTTPIELKISIVYPIFQNGQKQLISKYRRISIINTNKVF